MNEVEVKLVMSREQALHLIAGLSVGKAVVGGRLDEVVEFFSDGQKMEPARNALEWLEGKVIASYNERAKR